MNPKIFLVEKQICEIIVEISNFKTLSLDEINKAINIVKVTISLI